MIDDNKAKAKSKIAAVRSGGSTNLAGGWLKGSEEVARESTAATFNRTLLLTDGLANVGITSIEELSTHASELFRRGVSTSTFGVGLGYDEHLLEAMANAGGGNFHFLETLNAIQTVFEREFLELISVSLKETELSLQLPAKIRAEVSAGYHSDQIGEQFNVYLGSLYTGRTQSIYLKLQVEKDLAESELRIPISLKAKMEDGSPYQDQTSLTFRVVDPSEEAAAEADQQLMQRFAQVDMADKVNEALKREREGDRAGASYIMHDSMSMNQPYLSGAMRSKYKVMTETMQTGLSESQRKTQHRQEYDLKRGVHSVRDYRARLVNGVLFTDIEGASVVIDTGSPISVGAQAEWLFLNQVHQLSPDAIGITPAYLSREIGAPVDILMGSDILKKVYLTIDLQSELLHFSHNPLLRGGIRIPFKTLMGTPILRAKVAGQELDMFFDTGAKLTYVESQVVAGYTPIGEEQDFYPTIGRFTTPVYELPVEIGGLTLSLRVGILPPMLEKTMQVTGKRAILGTEILQHYVVSLAYPDNELVMEQ